jgi:O-methyltransferase involved in polyketide biosynthesis
VRPIGRAGSSACLTSGSVSVVKVELAGVPETLLWTLWHRTVEARRADAVLDDPRAVELVDEIEYPFAERFGGNALVAQWQALRVLRFDQEIRRFLAANPTGTVVALGEGLETQFWRVDNGGVRWVTVDLPETIELRERLLPRNERHTVVAGSAFDEAWMDEVDPANGVLITAQGLFMYFEFTDVERLLGAMRERFAGGALVFDAVRNSFLNRNREARGAGFQPPPWLWTIDTTKRRALDAGPLRFPRGRGILRLLRFSPVEILRTRL